MKPYTTFITLILLLGAWTQSLGQSQSTINKPITIVPDSQTCYNKSEMQAIAATLVYGQKLEKGHIIDSTRIDLLKKNIVDFKVEISNLEGAVAIYKYVEKETKAANDKTIKSLNLKNTWLKVGWIATTVFLAGTTTYFLIK